MDRIQPTPFGLSPAASDSGQAQASGDGIMNFGAASGSAISALGDNDDDYPVRTHDQLPDVDEYKAQGTVSSKTQQGNRMIKNYLASLLTIIVLIILICIVAILGNRRAMKQIANNDTEVDVRQPRVAEVLDFVGHIQEWSQPSDLMDTSSPQYLAARWIADIDPRYVVLDELEVFRTRYVLAILYYATHGDRWEHEVNWMTMHSYCDWNSEYPSARSRLPIRIGVKCDSSDNTTVTEIFLPSLDLQGELPSELGLLLDLEVLDLYNNDISGSIPDELKSLRRLKKLVLHNNHLVGSLPTWIDQCSDLETLDLAINKFTGPIPPEFAALSKLGILSLERNQITGDLNVLAKSQNLKLLALGNNKISGELTEDMISSWFRLADLDLSDNEMGGMLPPNLLVAQSLVTLDLSRNKFYGTIPYQDTENTRLRFLALFENELSGTIEDNIAKLRGLEHLDLSRNLLTGAVPQQPIAKLVQLKYLFLAFNPFEKGPIPPYWATLYYLADLSLQGTNRIGTIPEDLSLFENIKLMDLSNNFLTGKIPDDFGNLVSLQFLILKNNELTGQIPSTLQSLINLDTLVLDNNDFKGGSGHICVSVKPPTFVADCLEVGCSCCSLCCDDKSANCRDRTWFAPVDPSINYQNTRIAYKFNEEDIIYPLAGEPDMIAGFYDTFGMAFDDQLFDRFAGEDASGSP